MLFIFITNIFIYACKSSTWPSMSSMAIRPYQFPAIALCYVFFKDDIAAANPGQAGLSVLESQNSNIAAASKFMSATLQSYTITQQYRYTVNELFMQLVLPLQTFSYDSSAERLVTSSTASTYNSATMFSFDAQSMVDYGIYVPDTSGMMQDETSFTLPGLDGWQMNLPVYTLIQKRILAVTEITYSTLPNGCTEAVSGDYQAAITVNSHASSGWKFSFEDGGGSRFELFVLFGTTSAQAVAQQAFDEFMDQISSQTQPINWCKY